MTCRRGPGCPGGRAFTVRAILLCLVNNVREPIKQKPPQQQRQREKIQQQLKPFSSKQTAAEAVGTFLDILHDVLVLHCPLYSVQLASVFSVLIYWRLAHCLGCQKKEREKEGRGARRKGK